MPPALHSAFVARALARLPEDRRIVGVAAAGSWLTGRMDEHSDVDLVVAVAPEDHAAVVAGGATIAAGLGPLLACFPGDHLGEPLILICLYGPPLLHVDFTFLPVADAVRRTRKAAVLWERDGALTRSMTDEPGLARVVDLQWMEDRVWVWLDYGARKAARGELFEAIDALAFIRGRVLGPLLLTMHDRPPYGVRRVETVAGDDLPALRATVSGYDAAGCVAALLATADLYRRLRAHHATPALVRRTAAEEVVVAWLETLARSLG
jgi:hypothetical protein